MPSILGEATLSAKWRRNRTNSKKFDNLKVYDRFRNINGVRRLQLKNPSVQRANLHRYRFHNLSAEKKVREPKHLIDVLEGADEIVIVGEFAGFSREDLRVRVKGEKLTIAAEALDRKYRKSLNLPKRVIPSTIRTTYKNGVLEIRLRKAEQKCLDKIAG
jgi:HSP20 family molecular chaperone IbpA